MTSSGGKWRTVLASGSLLIVGAAAGIAGDRLLHRQGGDDQLVLMERLRNDPLAVIDSLIPMRPEQREQVAAILEARQTAIDAVWHDTHNRLQATLDSVVDEIAVVLDQDQETRFRALIAEVHGPRMMRAH